MKKRWKKIIRKWRKKIEKTIIKMPLLEDILYVFLIIFSLSFSALMFGIGQKIQTENYAHEKSELPTQFEIKTAQMVSGHPIERMIPFIAKQDKDVAAYMIAIAKKESNWGKYSPQKNGKGCFNYWGYRSAYNQTDSGYSCFKNPRQAVSVVGKRIQELLDQDINTSNEMVIWKCGHECYRHDPYSVNKWIKDVDWYYQKTNNLM